MIMIHSKMSMSTLLVLVVVVLLYLAATTEASIQVVELGRVYESRTDKYVGLQMRTGLEYPARMQYIADNPHLCGSQPWNVTVPHDGLPGECRGD